MSPKKAYQVLAFDGGPAGLLEVLLLEEIEKQLPGFLRCTKMFAGTSAGSINALVLASVKDGATKLDTLKEFWLKIGATFSNSPLGFAAAALGCGALFSNKNLIEALSVDEILGELTMKQLPKKALACAFEMQSGLGRTLSNLFEDDLSDCYCPHVNVKNSGLNMKCVDVAVSSGASPLVMPAHDGYVDGGVFSNNPTRPAVSTLATSLQKYRALNELEEVSVLSVAGGQSEITADIGNQSWGYFRWLLDPRCFLRVINLMLNGPTQVGGFVDKPGPDDVTSSNYFRLNPDYVDRSLIPFMQADPKDLEDTAQAPETKELVAKAVEWLKNADWVREDSEDAQEEQPDAEPENDTSVISLSISKKEESVELSLSKDELNELLKNWSRRQTQANRERLLQALAEYNKSAEGPRNRPGFSDYVEHANLINELSQ